MRLRVGEHSVDKITSLILERYKSYSSGGQVSTQRLFLPGIYECFPKVAAVFLCGYRFKLKMN